MNDDPRETDYLEPEDAELDARLRRAFEPERATDRALSSAIIDQLPSEPPGSGDHPPVPFDLTRWVPFGFGLAAGLLAAFTLFMTPLFDRAKVVQNPPPLENPGKTDSPPKPDGPGKTEEPNDPRATRALAWATVTRGAVALADTKGLDLVRAGASLDRGQRVVTRDDQLAVITLANGLTIELDRATGVALEEHSIRFEHGGLTVSRRSDTPEPRGIHVEWDQGSVESKAMVGDAIEIRSTKRGVRVTTIRGPAQVVCLHPGIDPPQRQLRPGDQLWITDEGPADVRSVNPWTETPWRLPLVEETDQPRYVSALLESARRSKRKPSDAEVAIRGLGARGGELALAFLGEAKQSDSARRLAATLASDLVTARSVEPLIGLLDDSDGRIRALAQTALVRLTGERIGGEPSEWRTEDGMALKSQALARKEWRDWWAEHRTHFLPTTP